MSGLDTLSLARELRAANIEGPQAEAIAAAIGKALVDATASKTDVAAVKSEVELVRVELIALRREVGQGNDALKSELNANIKASVESLRSSMILWLIGVGLALASLITALLKL